MWSKDWDDWVDLKDDDLVPCMAKVKVLPQWPQSTPDVSRVFFCCSRLLSKSTFLSRSELSASSRGFTTY